MEKHVLLLWITIGLLAAALFDHSFSDHHHLGKLYVDLTETQARLIDAQDEKLEWCSEPPAVDE